MATTEALKDNGPSRDLLSEGFNHLYVHEGALGYLATTSELDATDVFMFMGTQKLHGVVENILGLGGDTAYDRAWEGHDAARENAVKTMIGPDDQRFVDPFLQHIAVGVIGHDPRNGSSVVERLVPIGGPIVDRCFEQDYYTYGFDEAGAWSMRIETGPMVEWTAAIGAGTGPRDLAIVHGPNGSVMRKGQEVHAFNAAAIANGRNVIADYLVPAAPDIGPKGTVEYVRQERPGTRLSLAEVFELDQAIRKGFMKTVNVRIGMITDILEEKRAEIDNESHKVRMEQIEKLRDEAARVIGRHKLIRKQFYPPD